MCYITKSACTLILPQMRQQYLWDTCHVVCGTEGNETCDIAFDDDSSQDDGECSKLRIKLCKFSNVPANNLSLKLGLNPSISILFN